MRLGEDEQFVGVGEGGLKSTHLFAATDKVGSGNFGGESHAIRISPAAPNLRVNLRRGGEVEVLQRAPFDVPLKQWLRDPGIKEAMDTPMEITRTEVRAVFAGQGAFGPRE